MHPEDSTPPSTALSDASHAQLLASLGVVQEAAPTRSAPGGGAVTPSRDKATSDVAGGAAKLATPPSPPLSLGAELARALVPNQVFSPMAMRVLVVAELVVLLAVWCYSPFEVLPTPLEALRALGSLWTQEGLGQELIASFTLNVQALALSTLISLFAAYLTVLPLFRPLVALLSKGRFLSLTGFTFVFTLLVGGGHSLKLSLLVFGMTVFYVTSMAAVIAAIPRDSFDYARTLRMSEWRVVYEVVVLGTVADALEVLRQNAAIGWMMLTMVEGIARAEGGLGVVLIDQSHHMRLPQVFAVQLLILVVGLGQDALIGLVRRLCCPYAYLTLERA
jgi:NitT/TauT family transport system permease protein